MAAVSKVRVCGRWLWHRMNAGSCLWRSALLQSTFWLANATLPDLTLPLLWLNLTVELFCRQLWKRVALLRTILEFTVLTMLVGFRKKRLREILESHGKVSGHPEMEKCSHVCKYFLPLQIFLAFLQCVYCQMVVSFRQRCTAFSRLYVFEIRMLYILLFSVMP